MKISYSWLKQHAAIDLGASALSERLLALGFEVSGIERRGPAFRGVVTARILEVSKHPNADRLRLCLVDDGSRKFSVVCGAPNAAAGQTVPLARVGAELPGGRKLALANIRGVESQGMLCSGAELGLSTDHAGILQLPAGTPIGQDFAESLGPADEVLEVEISPNRPDCLSHRGLARELAAALKVALKRTALPELPTASGICPQIIVEAPEACPYYTLRLITAVKVAPSPRWLAAKLEAVGLRPINNVVDATNYILMDLGQPLHAFDASRLTGPEVRIRYARSNETIKALDGKSYALSPDNLLIADAVRPIAIAGVMGGEDTGVTDKTTSILLESAHFAKPVIRKSSQRLRLRSDSSYRFERGVDPGAVAEASERAAALIAELGGKDAKVSAVKTVGAAPAAAKPIAISAARINEILGSAFSEADIESALGAIAQSLEREQAHWRFTAPSHREDLETAWDLAEEAARLLGYEKVPAQAAPIILRPAKLTPFAALAQRCRLRLSAAGLLEAYNYDLVCEKALKLCGLTAQGAARLANPLSDDWTILRPTLLIGLLRNAADNINHSASSVRLYELGTQYKLSGSSVEERRHLAGLRLGPLLDHCWQSARAPDAGFYDAKGLLQDLLSGVSGLRWTPLRQAKTQAPADAFFHPGAALRVEAPNGPLATAGLLHPALARAWELGSLPVALFDLDLELLLELRSPRARFAPYSQFPTSWRDLSLLVDENTPYADLESAARRCAQDLQDVELRDVFAGKGVASGKRSFTLRLTFGRMDRTLTDIEVNAAIDRILGGLKAAGAKLRV